MFGSTYPHFSVSSFDSLENTERVSRRVISQNKSESPASVYILVRLILSSSQHKKRNSRRVCDRNAGGQGKEGDKTPTSCKITARAHSTRRNQP